MSHNISYTPLYQPIVHQASTLPIVQQPQQQQQQQQQISFQFTATSKQQQPQNTIASYGSAQLLAQPVKTAILGPPNAATATPSGLSISSNVLRQSWQQQQQQQQQPPILNNQPVISAQQPVIQTWVQSYQQSQPTQLQQQAPAVSTNVPSKHSLQLPQSFSFPASIPQIAQPWSTMNIMSSSKSNSATNTRRSQTNGLIQPIFENTSSTNNIPDGISIHVVNDRIDISCSKLINQLSELVDTLKINQILASNKTFLVNSLHEVEEQIGYLRGQLVGLQIPISDRLSNQEQQLLGTLKSSEQVRKEKEDEKKIPIDAVNIKENNNINGNLIQNESNRINRLKDSINGISNNSNNVKDQLNEDQQQNNNMLGSAKRNKSLKKQKSPERKNDRSKSKKKNQYKQNQDTVIDTTSPKVKASKNVNIIQSTENNNNTNTNGQIKEIQKLSVDIQNHGKAEEFQKPQQQQQPQQPIQPGISAMTDSSGNKKDTYQTIDSTNLRKSTTQDLMNRVNGVLLLSDQFLLKHAEKKNLRKSIGSGKLENTNNPSSFAGNDGLNGNNNTPNLEQQLPYSQSAASSFYQSAYQPIEQQLLQQSQQSGVTSQTPLQGQQTKNEQQQQVLKITGTLKDEVIEQSSTAATLIPQVLPNTFNMKPSTIGQQFNQSNSIQNILNPSIIKGKDNNTQEQHIAASIQQDNYFLPSSASPKQLANQKIAEKQIQKISFGSSIPSYEPLSKSFDVKPIGPFVAVSPVTAQDTNKSLQYEQFNYQDSNSQQQFKYLNTSQQVNNDSNNSYSNIKDNYAHNNSNTNDLIHLSLSQIGIDKNTTNNNFATSIPAVVLPQQPILAQIELPNKVLTQSQQQQQSQPLKSSLKTSIPFQDVQHGLKSSIPLASVSMTQTQQTALSSLKSSLLLVQPVISSNTQNLSNSYYNNLSQLQSSQQQPLYPQAAPTSNDGMPKFVDLVHSQYTGYGSGDKQQLFLSPGANAALGDSNILNSPASLGFNMSNIQQDKLQQTPFSAFSATDKPNLNSLARNITGLNSAFSPELVQSSHSLTQPQEQQQQKSKSTLETALNCKILKSDDEDDDDDGTDQVPEIQPFIKEEESTAAKAKKYLRKLKSSKSFFLPLYTEKNPFDYSLQNFCVGKKLGHGKFADVFAAFDKETGFRVALKQIKKSTIAEFKLSQDVINEIRIQSLLSHPSIIQLYGFFIDEDSVYLIQELACGQELFAEQKAQPYKKFSESQAVNIVKQVIEALIYMHQKQVIHRDIKPENIMVYNGLVKICDFGYATFIKENNLRKTFCGTLDYISPEMVQAEPYDYSVDVWSIGILTYELIIGNVPFQGKDHDDTFDKIVNSDLQFGRPVSFEAADFITKILERDPSKRLSIYDCLSHPFIQGEDMKRLGNEQKSALDIADLNKL